MRAERICALSRHVIALSIDTAMTAATQWLERTLDDSANKRIAVPEAFLTTDAILVLAENVFGGLVVHPEVVRRRLDAEIPFLATENVMMEAVRRGGDRQELHERLRVHARASADLRVVERGADRPLRSHRRGLRLRPDAVGPRGGRPSRIARGPQRRPGRGVRPGGAGSGARGSDSGGERARPRLKRRRPSGAFLILLCLEVACASRAASRPVSKPVPPSEAISGWTEDGFASWYGGDDGFEGKPTASGEIYDSSKMTAAHRDLPLGTVVRVTNLDNGKSVDVRINDRGPFIHGRVIDLSQEAARRLDLIGPGVGPVRIVILSPGVAPTPVPPAVAAGPWAVQVGSFGEPDRAARHAERLRAAGFEVYLEPYDGLTRVKIGPLDSRADAEEMLAKAEDAGFEGIVVPANR